jgi:hypothetical protein
VVEGVSARLPVELALLDELLAGIAFLEAESPIYQIRLRTSHGDPERWTWSSPEGFTRDASRRPTCILELDQGALGDLLAARKSCDDLLASRTLLVGGLEADWKAFLALFVTGEKRAAITAARLDRPSHRLRAKLVEEASEVMRQRFGSLAKLQRIRMMLEHWVAHHGADARLGRIETVAFPDLDSPPSWHDRDALQLDRMLHRDFDELRAEACAVLEKHRSGSALLVDSYRVQEARAEFPVAARALEELAATCSVVQFGYRIREPGVTPPLHSSGAGWAVTYQYGLIVPSGVHHIVDGTEHTVRERESLTFNASYLHAFANRGDGPCVQLIVVAANPQLTEIERAALKLVHDLLPAGTLLSAELHEPEARGPRADRGALARRVRAIRQTMVGTAEPAQTQTANPLLTSLLDPSGLLGVAAHHIIDDWNPDAYLDHEYGGTEIAASLTRIFRFVSSQLRRIGRQFDSALEFGCGPTLHNAAVSVPWTRRLDLADRNPDNLERLRRWLANRADAHDWTSLIGGAGGVLEAENDGQPASPTELAGRQALMRERIHVRGADILATLPLGEPVKYPLVTTYFCLEWVTPTIEGWRTHLARLVTLLEDGGWLVMAVSLETHFCIIDGRTFRSAFLSQQTIAQALTDIGLDASTIQSEVIPLDDAATPEATDGIRGSFVICGRKRTA